MYSILYKLNNNLTFHHYSTVATTTKEELIHISNHISGQNGNSYVVVVAVDERDKVCLSSNKLEKEDKDILVSKHNYTLKRVCEWVKN